MKFLVLALCVCAASAASFTPYGANKRVYAAVASANVAPVVPVVAKAVVAPVAPVAQLAKNYGSEAEAQVLRSESEVSPVGYNYVYETQNGISAQSSGTLKEVGDSAAVVATGVYRYVSPDGTPVEVTYTADENGFQPQGNVLPVAPPVPEAILRALQYIAERTPVDARKV